MHEELAWFNMRISIVIVKVFKYDKRSVVIGLKARSGRNLLDQFMVYILLGRYGEYKCEVEAEN